ncbi:hypothetical protein L6452_01791 [Arctium lappa]|uniref:Uncharacterized protein n=1 Tax=Arctium lappa TaxID=4217 RepID=A0ACB9FIK5_ARCLA|nr:hypothetical protein L6452_01791 [Arctium lappa]
MVRSNHNTRDLYQIFDELDEEDRVAMVNAPNVHYTDWLSINANRGFVVERGIMMTGLDSTTILGTITHRHWARFTSTPGRYHTELVREFYAAMVPEVFRISGTVWVRGRQVELSSSSINEYLLTPTNPDTNYHDGFSIDDRYYPELGEMAASLRHNSSNVWQPGTTELHHGELTLNMAFWSVFIKYSLLPSTHRTNVTIETAILLYAIPTGVYFNVGHFILGSILKSGCETRSLLNFPCLITYICKRAWIRATSMEEALTAPPSDICKKAYNYFCSRHALPNLPTEGHYRHRVCHQVMARQQEAPVRDVGPPPLVGGYPDAPPPWSERLIQTVERLSEGQERLTEGQGQLTQRLDHVLDQRHHGVTYQIRPRDFAPGPSSSRPQEDDSD